MISGFPGGSGFCESSEARLLVDEETAMDVGCGSTSVVDELSTSSSDPWKLDVDGAITVDVNASSESSPPFRSSSDLAA